MSYLFLDLHFSSLHIWHLYAFLEVRLIQKARSFLLLVFVINRIPHGSVSSRVGQVMKAYVMVSEYLRTAFSKLRVLRPLFPMEVTAKILRSVLFEFEVVLLSTRSQRSSRGYGLEFLRIQISRRLWQKL